MGVREATHKDLPALKDIVLKGLASDAVWQYCFPSASSRIAEAAQNHVETVLQRLLDSNDPNWRLLVVEAKSHEVVSLALCQILHQNQDQQNGGVADQIQQVYGVTGDAEGKTAKRIAALEAGITKTQQTYLSKHGHILFLHAVITHPHWKRQGFAKVLSRQMLQIARQKDAAVVTLASPFSGYVFYSGTSFANCGRTSVVTDGDIDNLELQVMVCTPPKMVEQRRSSIMDYFTGGGGANKAASTPGGSRRGSRDEHPGDQRRSSFLDMFSFGKSTEETQAAKEAEARRKSHT
ncbi:hypothetical protein F66182_3077 [Fusarium sp. NRRL 66182]|nr:hypothetical protein F66182_3077 [Fusarium sp. NRRL 66182]